MFTIRSIDYRIVNSQVVFIHIQQTQKFLEKHIIGTHLK